MYGNSNRVAVHSASRIASSPYHRNINRGNIHAPTFNLKLKRFIKKIVNYFAPLFKRPTSTRTVRRSVKASSLGARNKDDPHLEGGSKWPAF